MAVIIDGYQLIFWHQLREGVSGIGIAPAVERLRDLLGRRFLIIDVGDQTISAGASKLFLFSNEEAVVFSGRGLQDEQGFLQPVMVKISGILVSEIDRRVGDAHSGQLLAEMRFQLIGKLVEHLHFLRQRIVLGRGS